MPPATPVTLTTDEKVAQAQEIIYSVLTNMQLTPGQALRALHRVADRYLRAICRDSAAAELQPKGPAASPEPDSQQEDPFGPTPFDEARALKVAEQRRKLQQLQHK